MTTRTDVINSALRALGEPPMAGPDDATTWVRRCSTAFDAVARRLLSRHPWNFAQIVTQMGTSATTQPGWQYAYVKPADCLRIVRVSLTDQPDDVGMRYADSAGAILANQLNPYIRYVSATFVTLEGAWPELFADAVGKEIAAEVAPTTQGRGDRNDLDAKARRALREAKTWDALQQPNWTIPPGRFIRARAGYGTGARYDEG